MPAPMLDDAPGQDRADARERVELLSIRPIDINALTGSSRRRYSYRGGGVGRADWLWKCGVLGIGDESRPPRRGVPRIRTNVRRQRTDRCRFRSAPITSV